MTDRVTRTYAMRWPRWRTGYERPVNYLIFRWLDFVPLALVIAFVPASAPGWVFTVIAVWYFVLFPVVVWRRLRARRRFCVTQGHTPYKPVPELNEWRCLYCDWPLEVSDQQSVATSVAYAASEVDLARRRQSYYSDRR